MATPNRWNASSFRIEIGGLPAGHFKRVDGLSAETEVVENRSPGPTKWQNITLKKGYVEATDTSHKIRPDSSLEMKTAVRLVLHGFVPDERHKHLLQHWASPGAPRTATAQGQIVMIDSLGNPVRRWQFYEAWPCKWYVPELDSDSSSASGGSSVELALGKLVRL